MNGKSSVASLYCLRPPLQDSPTTWKSIRYRRFLAIHKLKGTGHDCKRFQSKNIDRRSKFGPHSWARAQQAVNGRSVLPDERSAVTPAHGRKCNVLTANAAPISGARMIAAQFHQRSIQACGNLNSAAILRDTALPDQRPRPIDCNTTLVSGCTAKMRQ